MDTTAPLKRMTMRNYNSGAFTFVDSRTFPVFKHASDWQGNVSESLTDDYIRHLPDLEIKINQQAPRMATHWDFGTHGEGTDRHITTGDNTFFVNYFLRAKPAGR